MIYRVAQESLTNAMRHAHASRVQVALAADDFSVRLVVADDGVGPPATESAAAGGLRFMRERAIDVGARLIVAARRGGGTAVALVVPHES